MAEKEVKLNGRAVLHEFIGMTLFVYTGCGVAKTGASGTLDIAFAFGMAIMVLVYCTAHTSGGQLNWAVTFGLMCAGMLEPLQGCANMLAQLFGAVLGATLLLATLPENARGTLGSNQIQGDYTKGAAFIAEMIFTYFLVFTVFQTAIDARAITGTDQVSRPVAAPIAIGFCVFLAHLFLIPITGCSINPTRSFGPALVATIDGEKGLFDDFWVFFVAPMLGGAIAGLTHKFNGEAGETEDKGNSV